MSEERCVLCNKPYDYEHYYLFGRGCLNNLYELLGIEKPPRGTKDKEMYLCNRIAWRNFKFFLSRNKKYELTQKYVALKYLDRINFNQYPYNNKNDVKEFDFNILIDDVKEKISKDIKSISIFSSKIIETISLKLNDVYDYYNDVLRFEEIIKEIQNLNLEELDQKLADDFLNALKFAFDVTKKETPVLYEGFYTIQYLFWELVIAGGLMTNMKLSAKLLRNALAPFGQDEVKDLDIVEKEYVDDIRKDDEFKNLKQYFTSFDSVPKSLLSMSLNNLGVASSEYGVLKTYEVRIKLTASYNERTDELTE